MTKTEIINAAFKIWGRNLYRKTSLSQLARGLRVSKPALYRHFVSKQAISAAMAEHFFDDFAVSVKADFEKALLSQDTDDGILIIIQSIVRYFAKNTYSLIFSLVNIYDRNIDDRTITDRIKERGADMSSIRLVLDKKYKSSFALLNLVSATLTFYMTINFFKRKNSLEKIPSEAEIQKIITLVNETVKHGLKYTSEKLDSIDFEGLEKQIYEMKLEAETEPLFKAVAEAVAEAGPWDVSMDMVAKRMGLSKSSLYGHLKNRKDMLRRLFIGEFKRIIKFARQGINHSGDTVEQLYLGLFSITVYMRCRPEILITMDWIRNRKLDIGKPEKNLEIFRLFEDVKIESLLDAEEEEKQQVSHWILFLLINVLKNSIFTENEPRENFNFEKIQNEDIRILLKFITLGLGGFKR